MAVGDEAHCDKHSVWVKLNGGYVWLCVCMHTNTIIVCEWDNEVTVIEQIGEITSLPLSTLMVSVIS